MKLDVEVGSWFSTDMHLIAATVCMKVDYSIRMTNGYLISDFKFH